MIRYLLFLFVFLVTSMVSAQQIYVAPGGSDATGTGDISAPYGTINYAVRQAVPGDTVFLRAGTYFNEDYNDGDIWTGAPVARIIAVGEENNYIVITRFPGEEPVIEFDGVYGFLVQNAAYVKVIGLTFDGASDGIADADAVRDWGLYRLDGVTYDLAEQLGIDIEDPALEGETIPYIDTEGNPIETNGAVKPILYNSRCLVANKSHHIEFIDNVIRNVPSAAIRAQQSDYILIEGNEVHSSTYHTTQGVGAITISEATVRPDAPSSAGVKIEIKNNRVYGNENRLASWNPSKDFVKLEIDEGTGIFLTRNNDTYAEGYMRISNNLSYLNGASGIVCHFTNRAIIDHNTVYDNGTTNGGLPGGIGTNTVDDVQIINNIAYAKPDKWALGVLALPADNVVVDGNIIYNQNGTVPAHRRYETGWTLADPLMEDPAGGNFELTAASGAIDAGVATPGFVTDIDFAYRSRDDGASDVGALEFQPVLPITLAFFNARAVGEKEALLDWETASERESHYFVIQRSVDGMEWTDRGRVFSRGTVGSPTRYTYVDEVPGAGRYYYRLTEVSLTGAEQTLPVREVAFRGDIQRLRLTPNPAANFVDVSGGGGLSAGIRLTDALGRDVTDKVVASRLDNGWRLLLEALAPGTYYLRSSDGSAEVLIHR